MPRGPYPEAYWVRVGRRDVRTKTVVEPRGREIPMVEEVAEQFLAEVRQTMPHAFLELVTTPSFVEQLDGKILDTTRNLVLTPDELSAYLVEVDRGFDEAVNTYRKSHQQ